MNSFFVTGTDTDVGKTCVSAALAKHFRDNDVDVGVMKPFASGYKATPDSVSADVEILMKYSGVTDSIDLVNPYYFEIPTSPYDACKQLNLEIDVSKVIESYKQLTSIHDVVIVEGIGGIMTPISKNYFLHGKLPGITEYLAKKNRLNIVGEWWFGVDMVDLYRSILVSGNKLNQGNYKKYLDKFLFNHLDQMQNILDKNKICSEVQIVFKKKR